MALKPNRPVILSALCAALVASLAMGCADSENPVGANGDSGSAGVAGSAGSAGVAGAAASDNGGKSGSAIWGNDPVSGEFTSDSPNGNNSGSDSSGGSGGSSGGEAGGAGASPESPNADGENDPERAILEADIIQVKDNKLYAFSQYSGLSIIDVSQRDHLSLLGRYRIAAVPFEMYVQDNLVWAMYSDFWRWEKDENDNWSWVTTSRVEAIDVSDSHSPRAIGSYNIPGAISDSRIVGDILYTVSFEDGYCWDCDTIPTTTVTSFSTANPTSIGIVDQLAFQAPGSYGWYRRSVTATQDRLYIAGLEWSGNYEDEGSSTIQVVDITDPAGSLLAGAAVVASGQISSRWQMDEHEGVLRVISQPWEWWNSGVPTIETYSVASSMDVTPLAKKPMVLPQDESLRTVRFDGDRAYAITAVQTDPLFTIDLSNPANPVQLGELVMPGWVYHIEPRGNRLYALGFDNANAEGSMNVSLFDVSNMSQPTMLERVSFGGDWAWVPEDQDRIHKAFKILEDEHMIMVPYSGWDSTQDYCGQYNSGIQLIDFTDNSLTKRGVAGTRGNARRAFLHDERLFAVSDEQVRTFDIANKDQPLKKKEFGLATNVNLTARVGENIVRVTSDWWTNESRLDVVPGSDPASAQVLGSLDLKTVAEQSGNTCYSGYWLGKVFTNGDFAYLLYSGYDYNTGESNSKVAIVDITNPASPKLRGTKTFAGMGYYYYGYYGMLTGGDQIVQNGSTLSFLKVTSNWYNNVYSETRQVTTLDLSNPDQPRVGGTIDLPEGSYSSGLLGYGDLLLTSHATLLDNGKVKFYVDRIRVDSPDSLQLLTSVNVPGSLVTFDESSNHLLTVDYKHESTHVTGWEECYNNYASSNVSFTYDDDTYTSGTCTVIHRAFKLLDVSGGTVEVLDTEALPDTLSMWGQLLPGDDRVFGYSYNYGWYEDGGYSGSESSVIALGGIRSGTLQLANIEQQSWNYQYPIGVSGKTLITAGYSPPSITIIDSSNLGSVQINNKSDMLGYVYSTQVDDNRVICSLGPWGVQVVNLELSHERHFFASLNRRRQTVRGGFLVWLGAMGGGENSQQNRVFCTDVFLHETLAVLRRPWGAVFVRSPQNKDLQCLARCDLWAFVQ